MTASETVRHVLGVAVRIDDHFVAAPVPDELDVRLDTFRPSLVRGGVGRRHDDGTYRFIDVDDGVHQLHVASPDARWTTFDPLPSVVTPNGSLVPLVVTAWPTPVQVTPLGLTAVRGKLLGTPAATIARRVELDVNGVATPYHTITSSLAEFLFWLPGHLVLDPDGRVPITIRVIGAVVTSLELIEGEQHTSIPGASVAIATARESRVRIHVT